MSRKARVIWTSLFAFGFGFNAYVFAMVIWPQGLVSGFVVEGLILGVLAWAFRLIWSGR